MSFWIDNFWSVCVICALVFTAGIYVVMASRNLVRILIGIELLTKSVTLLLIEAGVVTGRTGLTQALVIALIVVEVVAITVAAGIVVSAHRATGTIDAKSLTELKG